MVSRLQLPSQFILDHETLRKETYGHRCSSRANFTASLSPPCCRCSYSFMQTHWQLVRLFAIFFIPVLVCVGCTMEMGRSGNGGGRVVTFDDAISGRRRNGSSSLSSYLDMGRDADGGRATPRPLPAHAMASRRRTYADGELDVFAAERYFRGAMDGDGGRKEGFSVTAPAVAVQVQQALVETAAARPAADPEAVVMAKPSSTCASTVSFTASSASSANSQTALFRGGLHRRRSSRDNRCCVQVGVLMRTCSGKRSVRVDDGCAAKEAPDAAEPAAATGMDWYRELRMHKAALGLSRDGNTNGHGLVAAGLPPSLNLGMAKVAAIGREVTTGEEEAAELTFSSSTSRRSNFTLVAPVRANVPASGGRVGEPSGGAGKVGRGGGGGAHRLHDNDDDDDAGSESSSDLFEIKSLTIGDCPYEPSEASIQWSVVTADASERGDRVPARCARGPPVAGRQLRGHRPAGILAGCASHRAVDVSVATTKAVPNASAAVVAKQQRRSEGFDKARNGA
ncbi:LOW QUALITY PROTEIN: protein PHYTOCHROME KINASE SUBSTRATE 3-like [Miscanthus floridulus]|uniref:LOW QUALITY PROTEIN: protein PHYTOCHROME KINASE SUBSTRATE 3-like n=1 Tax=Miscanthus floridulus TaxID=154761 RepID=UPI00345AC93C